MGWDGFTFRFLAITAIENWLKGGYNYTNLN